MASEQTPPSPSSPYAPPACGHERSRMVETALHISSDAEGEHIIVKALKPERFTHYGFGTFLENIVEGEVTITLAAQRILLATSKRSGLQGLEFWPDNRIAWGNLSPQLMIPIEAINVPEGAKSWIEALEKKKPDRGEDE